MPEQHIYAVGTTNTGIVCVHTLIPASMPVVDTLKSR